MGKKQIPNEINISKNTMIYKNTSITPREIQDNSTSIKQVQDLCAQAWKPGSQHAGEE